MIWTRRNWVNMVATGTLCGDAAALAASTLVAFLLRFRVVPDPSLAANRFTFFAPVVISFVVATLLSGLVFGMYTRHRTSGTVDLLARVTGTVTVGALLTVAATFFAFPDRLEFARLFVVYMWLFGILAVVAVRSFLAYGLRILNRRGFGVERVLVVGAGAEGREVVRRMQAEPGQRFQIVGAVDGFAESRPDGAGEAPVLGQVASISALIAEHDVDKVVIAVPSLSHEALLDILEQTEASYADVWLLPDLFQLMVSPVTQGGVRGLPLIALNEVRLRGLSRFAKRSLDLSVAATGLILLSAPLLLIATVIRFSSRGPVFYVQDRVGRDGRRFPIVKFRTMIDEAEQYGETWTVVNDPRITLVGRVLRRFWLDELPQLINVLKGDMSLVGPRPERPAYVQAFEQEYSRYMVRHRERSGITGWAQVNGLRGDSSIMERTRYDLYYVENWSLLFDLRILFRTMFMVLRGDAL